MDDLGTATAEHGEFDEAIEHDPESNTYRAAFDGSAESPSTAVVSVVATVADRDPLEMESLYSVVDPDALDTLMNPVRADPSRGDTHVGFTLDGHEVTVHSYGVISVRPPDEMNT